MKGKFITFEGCEGVGKSKQLSMLKSELDELGIDYVLTREPGGTLISEKIRNIILDKENADMTDECEALLYAAARNQHINGLILPSLRQGKLVICDRYIDSSFAYQSVARGLGFEYIEKINDVAIKSCMPDLTLFLDLAPDEAFKRKGGVDDSDRMELSGMDFHNNVYSGYVETAKRYPERIKRIDCGGTKEQTHQKIMDALKEKGII